LDNQNFSEKFVGASLNLVKQQLVKQQVNISSIVQSGIFSVTF